jgi:cytochrome c biogenesis protein CcdA
MTATSLLGLSQHNLQTLVAVILFIISIFFIFSGINNHLSNQLSSIANFANNMLNKIPTSTAYGQLATGLLLGAVWSPCAGPSIGFAISLVTIQNDMLYGALIMFVFGIGASIPLILIAYGSSSLIKQHTKSLQNLYTWTKIIMGLFILTYSLLLLTGWDKNVESIILNILPEYIINLTTKY